MLVVSADKQRMMKKLTYFFLVAFLMLFHLPCSTLKSVGDNKDREADAYIRSDLFTGYNPKASAAYKNWMQLLKKQSRESAEK